MHNQTGEGITEEMTGTEFPRLSNSERAYRELKRLIMANLMPAGSQLLELEGAARLGMSRTPVREAMVRLAQEGIVEIRPRHGMRVLPVSADDMQEIYEVLTVLDGQAAANAAERGLSQEDAGALNGTVSSMEDALRKGNLDAWSEADHLFHALLVEMGNNRRLMGFVEQVSDQAHRVRMLTLRLRPVPEQSNREHAAIVAAILARDTDTARRLAEDHRRRGGAMLVELLRKTGLAQL